MKVKQILFVILSIIIIYCLIPKWQYIYLLKESVKNLPVKPFNDHDMTDYKYRIYKCNTITGNCIYYDPEKAKWVKLKKDMLFWSASIGHNQFIDMVENAK